MLEPIIELSLQLIGGLAETADTGFNPKTRSEKVHKHLSPFQGRPVLLRTGEVLRGGRFQINETTEISMFKAELKDETLILCLDFKGEQVIEVPGKVISRFYTGKKSNTRVCINTNGVDYLIDLVEEPV